MTHYQTHALFYNQLIYLRPEEVATPLGVLRDFFDTYPFWEIRQHLYELLLLALTTDAPSYSGATSRNAVTNFCQELEVLLEAAWLLHTPDTPHTASR